VLEAHAGTRKATKVARQLKWRPSTRALQAIFGHWRRVPLRRRTRTRARQESRRRQRSTAYWRAEGPRNEKKALAQAKKDAPAQDRDRIIVSAGGAMSIRRDRRFRTPISRGVTTGVRESRSTHEGALPSASFSDSGSQDHCEPNVTPLGGITLAQRVSSAGCTPARAAAAPGCG
jgi:hypothetical protein